MKIKKILFVCAANVGRSQMAEGYYNFFTDSEFGSSAALVEDRREKYHHKPIQSIQEVMVEDGIDISSQKINILTPESCRDVDHIVLLLNIDNIESEFQIHNQSPRNFLYENYADKLIMYPISDPYNRGYNSLISIRNQIKEIILKMR